jgi:hypothetical protein
LRDTTIGALNVFGTEPSPMEQDDLLVARAFADLAAISILQQRATSESQRVNEQLASALTSRIVIEQAKGVIFERGASTWPRRSPDSGATPATTTSASPTSPAPPSRARSIRRCGDRATDPPTQPAARWVDHAPARPVGGSRPMSDLAVLSRARGPIG